MLLNNVKINPQEIIEVTIPTVNERVLLRPQDFRLRCTVVLDEGESTIQLQNMSFELIEGEIIIDEFI